MCSGGFTQLVVKYIGICFSFTCWKNTFFLCVIQLLQHVFDPKSVNIVTVSAIHLQVMFG